MATFVKPGRMPMPTAVQSRSWQVMALKTQGLSVTLKDGSTASGGKAKGSGRGKAKAASGKAASGAGRGRAKKA